MILTLCGSLSDLSGVDLATVDTFDSASHLLGCFLSFDVRSDVTMLGESASALLQLSRATKVRVGEHNSVFVRERRVTVKVHVPHRLAILVLVTPSYDRDFMMVLTLATRRDIDVEVMFLPTLFSKSHFGSLYGVYKLLLYISCNYECLCIRKGYRQIEGALSCSVSCGRFEPLVRFLVDYSP